MKTARLGAQPAQSTLLALWMALGSVTWCGSSSEVPAIRRELTPPARANRAPRCRLVEQAESLVRCNNGQMFFFDDQHAFFKANAVAATCSYRTLDEDRSAFYKHLQDGDLLHAVLGEEPDCYDARSILGVDVDLASGPSRPRRVVKPNGGQLLLCPEGTLWLEGHCRKAQETTLHSDSRVQELIRRLGYAFYRSSSFVCPGKEAFVALSELEEALTGTPIPGAGKGVAIDELIPPPNVPREATGIDPLLAVSCGFNNESGRSFRASFFCEKNGTCFQQGDSTLPHNCEAFSPGKQGVGVQFWEHQGTDCVSTRRFQNGGEEGTFALRKLGPGVYLKIVQDNWDDIFYHGLVFSKDPTVVAFWQMLEE